MCFLSKGQATEEPWPPQADSAEGGDLVQMLAAEKGTEKTARLEFQIGRLLMDAGRYQEAISRFDYVLREKTRERIKKIKSLVCIGVCYYMVDDIKDAQRAYETAISWDMSNRSHKAIRNGFTRMGLSNDYDAFTIKETEHIRFHFHPLALDSIKNLDQFIQRHVAAYDSIQQFFHSRLPKKIDLYIWNSDTTAFSVIHGKHGFHLSRYCVAHSAFNYPPGHEIAHIVSYYTAPRDNMSFLVEEGTAICFDHSGRNNLKKAQDMVRKYSPGEVSVKDIWDKGKGDKHVTYWVAGAFIEYLIATKGKDKFIQLLSDQTYESAQTIYGDEFTGLVANFEKLVLQ